MKQVSLQGCFWLEGWFEKKIEKWFGLIFSFLSQTAGSFWDPQCSQTLLLGTPSSPVTKMVPVGGKLWCGSQNRVLIINTTTLVQEVGEKWNKWLNSNRPMYFLTSLSLPPLQHWFQVGTDSSRCVTCMVAYGQGVWLALQGSAQVKLYHAQTWESLTEVDVAPAVHKMLAGKMHEEYEYTHTRYTCRYPSIEPCLVMKS